MSVSIKSYLNTKKASKLPEDIRTYIEGYGNNYKAVAILRIAYKLLKKKEDVTVSNIEKVLKIIDNVYIEDNDNYIGNFYHYSKLVDCYLNYEDIDKLKKVAEIPFVNLVNSYRSERLFYKHYMLIISDVDEGHIDKIMKSEIFIYENEINRDVIGICDFISIILDKINTQSKILIKKIAESNLINDLLSNNTYISEESKYYTKSAKVFMEYLSKKIEYFKKDEKGYVLLEEASDDLNYYKKFINVFKNDKHCQNNSYRISKAIRYRKKLMGNEVVFNDKECFKAEFYEEIDFSKIIVTISPRTIMYKSGSINTLFGDVYSFFSYRKTEIFINVKGKTRPALLKDLVNITRYNFVQSYIEKILDDIAIEYPFAKDFKQLYKKSVECGFAVIPMSLNEIFIYHNWDEYFKSKYKAAKKLNYNYNKLLPSVSYALIKCSRYIKDSDIGLLYNTLAVKPWIAEDNINRGIKNEGIKNVMIFYYLERISDMDEDTYGMLEDFIMMSVNNKIQISLRINSEKKIAEKHDKLMWDLWEKENKNKKDEIIVKENTKYKELRELLPPQYEWITTSNRLLEESKIQKHCVWQYESKVKKDECAIYSYVSRSNKRHTIEFNYNKKRGYFVKQIQKFHDRGHDKEVLDDINKILSCQKI